MRQNLKSTDVGLGLRLPHYSHIFAEAPQVDFFEIISENFMVEGGLPLRNLDRILERYPVVQHGVSLSIASVDPLDWDYLKKLKQLTERTKTPFFSDHLCWSRFNSHHFHDLLPIPYTEENAKFIAEKARQVQDFMEIPFGLENLSTYIGFKESTLEEWEFYRMVVEEAGVSMMLDINNVFVSAVNHGFDPKKYIDALPLERVLQVHLAGPTQREDGTFLDTHDQPVRDEVWDLYRYAWKKSGTGFPTLLEWDDQIPEFPIVHAEALKALKEREAVYEESTL